MTFFQDLNSVLDEISAEQTVRSSVSSEVIDPEPLIAGPEQQFKGRSKWSLGCRFSLGTEGIVAVRVLHDRVRALAKVKDGSIELWNLLECTKAKTFPMSDIDEIVVLQDAKSGFISI